MLVLRSWLVLAVAGAGAAQLLTEEQYYSMPRLFHLDDYSACLAPRGALYCLGTFELRPRDNLELFRLMEKYSAHKDHFNYTRLYRGLCVSKRCPDAKGGSSRKRFARCVDDWARSRHGLGARLATLDYCKTKPDRSRPVDTKDLAFLAVIGVLVLFNLLGTAYDLLFKSDKKANELVLAWSVADNLRRLGTARVADPQSSHTLKPLHGMKTLTLMLVMLEHTAFAYYMTYVHNPSALEQISSAPLAILLRNGTVVVQTFLLLAAFLLTHALLQYARDLPTPLSLNKLPLIVVARLLRIAPLNAVVIWAATSWWARAGDGPLWAPLIAREAARCRDKWWAQLLFVNNFVRPHDRCLIQTWFLAVDMQLYVVAAALALLLARWPRVALRLLGCFFVASIGIVYVLASKWNLKAMLFIINPESLRVQFAGQDSFAWLYTAPWGSLSATIAGVFVAFLHRHMEEVNFNPKERWWAVAGYRLSLPLGLCWVCTGWYVQEAPAWVQPLYSALDRPIFIMFCSILTIGLLYKVDELWWRFLSWRPWEVLGRMSLSVLLVHWCITLAFLAVRPQPVFATVLEIGSTWTLVMLATYLAALPTYLLVEAPVGRFLKGLFL